VEPLVSNGHEVASVEAQGMEAISTVGVVGLGTMGAGIVEVFAKQGLTVTAVEINDEALDRGRGIIEKSTSRAVERGRLEIDARDALMSRITWTTDFEALAQADLVIEAVPERMEIKRDLFGRLDALCKPSAILATNTSSLSVTQIAATTARPDRVVGMHFFNPAPVMKLVEVIRTVLTAPDVIEAVSALATGSSKTPVVVGDRAGFVANTLLIGYLNDAVRVFDESSVTREGIDAAMSVGVGLPMGPLALCDLIGLDVCLEVVDVLFSETRDPVHAPAPLLRAMVAAGLLGRKTGRGFYTYDKPGSGTVVDDAGTPSGTLPGTPALAVVVVGEGGHSDQLAQACEAADLVVTRLTYDSFDPAHVAADAVVLVDVSPIQRARDIAVAMEDRRADVVGVHFLHPGPKGLAVEIALTPFSSPVAVATAALVVQRAGAEPVVCDDLPGLVAGRLLTVYLNDAVRMVASGYASPDDVDAAMKLGCGYARGPIEFLEVMNPATICDALEAIHSSTRQPRHAPVALLRDSAVYGRNIRELVAQPS